MLRIIGGRFRGRRLHTPRGLAVRPTADRVKACIFDVLQDLLPGSRVVDLYAGCGNLGLEALSRGAHAVVLVEAALPALGALQRNLDLLGVGGEVEVVRRDALRYLAESHAVPFDVVLADPPYAAGAESALLATVGAALRPGGWFALQHDGRVPMPPTAGLHAYSARRFGATVVDFFYREEDTRDATGRPNRSLPGDV
jgi:16S rRNA (guanine966-N2)-methyltransferase